MSTGRQHDSKKFPFTVGKLLLVARHKVDIKYMQVITKTNVKLNKLQ